MDGEEDEWVDNTELIKKNAMPVPKRDDPAEVIEINARLYKVVDLYIDEIVDNMLSDQGIQMTNQDKELLHEGKRICEGNKPQVKEATMRVAAMLVVDVIEKLNRFEDETGEGSEKKSILVFLPGLHEIFEFIEFINETYDY